MRRGRRLRGNVTTMHATYDDPSCASPKRKEYKLNDEIHTIKTDENFKQVRQNVVRSTRSQAITNFFLSRDLKESDKESIIDLTDDNTCDGSDLNDNSVSTNTFDLMYPKKQQTKNTFKGFLIDDDSKDLKSNIFLQAPVLSLNIDKSPNQPSSIILKKTLEVPQNFGGHLITPKKEGALDLSKPTQVTEIDSTTLLNSDSNSCDSGVVADKIFELSPSRRRKPATPHRIVCPSPVKHIVTSPLAELEQRKNFKSKKRLNVNQLENIPKNFVPKLIEKKPILNSSANPSAKQNTTNNTTTSHNTKLTEFFPVRRSVRKTKKEVQAEQNKSIEQALIAGCEDGLEVRVFLNKGRGVVTTRNFARGEYVVEYTGDLIDSTEAQRREEAYANDQNTGCYMYYFKHKNTQHCIDATAESGRLGRLINHSRNGNIIPRTIMIKNVPRLVLFAKDDIAKGEEVTYDYGDRSKESLIHHPWLAL